MPHLRSILRNSGLICLGTLIGILLLEGALEVGARSVLPSTVSREVPDERLGYRPNPHFPGHDSRGWRNSSPLEHAEIVVFGDSQTYGGTSVPWPQRVGALLHQPVYQMAAGGYGPAHYVLFLEEVLAFKPKVIIAAYYYGNDLYDSYQFVYKIGDFKHSTRDAAFESLFASPDPKSRETIIRAETLDPELLRRKYLDCRKPVEVPDPRLQVVHDVLASPPLAPLSDEGMWQRELTFLTAHSALVQVLRKRLFPTVEAHPNPEDVWPKLCPRYRDQQLTTRFNPGYRILALDKTDPRIVEGERIAFLAYRLIAQRCRAPHCSFYVMMIPTKETAFRARIESSLEHQSYMVELWNAEERARANASAFFAREHIATIDTLPFLEKVIASNVNPYPEDSDGHPVEAGYDAIARAVGERLERDGMGR